MTVCVIPARGGSTRIPRKNIRQFCGRPMIAWPIRAAIAAGCFDRIVVSTDSPSFEIPPSMLVGLGVTRSKTGTHSSWPNSSSTRFHHAIPSWMAFASGREEWPDSEVAT